MSRLISMTDPTPVPGPVSEPRSGPSGNFRLGAVIAVAIAAAFVAWLLIKNDDNGSSAKRATPEATTPRDLRTFAGTVDIPVYWAGTRPNTTYELTQTSKGYIYIRYLPKGVQIGDRRPNFTTIGTYPYKNAYGTLQKAGTRKGARVQRI